MEVVAAPELSRGDGRVVVVAGRRSAGLEVRVAESEQESSVVAKSRKLFVSCSGSVIVVVSSCRV